MKTPMIRVIAPTNQPSAPSSGAGIFETLQIQLLDNHHLKRRSLVIPEKYASPMPVCLLRRFPYVRAEVLEVY